ncbi:MAG: ribose transport system permease protein [Thermoleophilaceae bacterium]|nr:ribose transport system permease protein [Thermoleophilaceae bacterium]
MSEADAPVKRPNGGDRLSVGLFLQRYAILVVWVAVIITFSILRPETFFTLANFQTIFGTQTVLLIVTLGLLVPLAAGEFDLSTGAVLGFASTMTAYLNVVKGWPVLVAIGVVIVGALTIGAINALLVVRVGVPSIVATLGTGTLLTGIGLGISGSIIIGGVSDSLVEVTTTRVFGLPLAFYFGVLLCVAVWYVFMYTPLGRYMRFVAEGPEVARLSGLRVDGIRGGALVASAVISALAGITLVGSQGAADPSSGADFLLPAFAGAFLGAAAIRPGEFNPWGSFVAVYFLVTGITGLQLLGLAGWVEQVFYGASLLIAVTLSQIAANRLAATST